MIKDRQSYVVIAATYKRVGRNRWTCEQSRIEPLHAGETWDDREEWQLRRVSDDCIEVRAAFRAEPKGERYIPLLPMREAQDTADRAFRSSLPEAHLESIDRPTNASLVSE